MFRGFRGYMPQLFHDKVVVYSVYNLKYYENRLLQKILFFRGSRSQMFMKKVLLR